MKNIRWSACSLKGHVLVLALAGMSCLGLLAPVPASSSPPSNAFRFLHDPDGRLKAAIDPEGSTAVYGWDSDGNLLSIVRHESSELSVVGLSPSSAQIGDTVTIEGTGFSTTPGTNTVKFNGTGASVIAATLTALTVKVPPGATSGTVTVATGSEGPVSSPQSFTVAGSSTPQINSISPSVAAPGEEVTISGSNFEAGSYSNVVTINGAQAQVIAASSTSLNILVPSARLGGSVALTTEQGSVSGPDLFVPPNSAAPSTVSTTGRVALGNSFTAEVKAASKMALTLVDGTKGQKLTLLASEAGFSGEIRLFTPAGEELGGSPNFTSSGSALLGPVTLPETGTYTLKVQGTGENTGTVKVSTYPFEDVSGSITPTKEGATQAVSITTPGQVASYTVEVKAGQQLSTV